MDGEAEHKIRKLEYLEEEAKFGTESRYKIRMEEEIASEA